MTSIFETYQKMTKGSVLTLSMIDARLRHHNIYIGGERQLYMTTVVILLMCWLMMLYQQSNHNAVL